MHPKTLLDIALMAAILPAPITIGGKRLTAMSAGKMINGLLIDHLRMFTPPFHPAFITTENTSFHILLLHKPLSAVFAVDIFFIQIITFENLRSKSSKPVSAAEGFNRFVSYASTLRYNIPPEF